MAVANPAASGSALDKPFEPTLTKAAAAKAGLSKPTPAALPDDELDEAPTGVAAGAPASRVPSGARRTRRLGDDVVAEVAAALSRGAKPATAGDHPGAGKPAPAPVGEQRTGEHADPQSPGERADSSVPVARSSSDPEQADLQAAAPAGGRRRKAAEASTEPAGKATRPTRRTAPPKG